MGASSYAVKESIFPQAAQVGPHDGQRREWDRFDHIYHQYQTLLRETNTNTLGGKVVAATESLLTMSNLLLSNTKNLGELEHAARFWSS